MLNLTLSRDVLIYKTYFYEASPRNFIDRFTLGFEHLREAGFYFIQNVVVNLVPFHAYLAIVIFLALLIKYLALLRLNPKPNIFDVLPYFLVLGLLHEGTQLRIACALSVIFWAMVYFSSGKRPLAFILIVMAVFFHNTTLVFFAPFLLACLPKRWLKTGYIIVIGFLLLIFLVPFDILGSLVKIFTSKYSIYFSQQMLQEQNTSGLFNYFFLFPSFLTYFIWKYFAPSTDVWTTLKKLAICSGSISVGVLFGLNFSVIIATRLADQLLFPVTIVLGATCSQLYYKKKYTPLCAMLVLLSFYAVARAYFAFRKLD